MDVYEKGKDIEKKVKYLVLRRERFVVMLR